MLPKNTCGELNGKWAFLFKASLSLIPIIAGLQGWVALQIWDLTKFKIEIEQIDPQRISDRVTVLELEAARHGWNGEG